MDSDGDGVYDGIDKCPGTPSGTAVGADGCPEKRLFTEDRKTFVLQGVNFETDSAKLTGDSTGILDGVAATLKEWPNVTVEVGGHTDSRGSDAYNQSLSERRAKSVMDYLVSKGIDARRMTSRGYGEAEPIADNGTSEGRLKNRRVELKQTN
ncbi:MAG: OmpA family protein [Planctomycetota bacterium]|nr:OmpA family protein [Planctomycetota bacterium]